MLVNTNHEPSISRNRVKSQSHARPGSRSCCFIVALALLGCPAAAAAADNSCTRALGLVAGAPRLLKTVGTEPAQVELGLAPGRGYLLEVDEQGNDALVEVLDSQDQLIARADHPERRSGTRRAVVTSPDSGSLTVRVTGKEHANARGTATIRAFDLTSLQARPDCLA
ncbi:MAG TPA: hypothetical protein VLV25_13200, partial [Steroidobacteraceae bacterium]|nr:hypothetical protein [Steroidobacteraceae bacterium]